MHQGNCHVYLVELLDPDSNFYCVFWDSGASTGYILSTHPLVLKQVLASLSEYLML